MKKLVLVVSLVAMSSAAFSSDSAQTTPAASSSRFACIQALPANFAALVSNNPYWAVAFAFVAGVVATKAVDAYVEAQDLDEEDFA